MKTTFSPYLGMYKHKTETYMTEVVWEQDNEENVWLFDGRNKRVLEKTA